MEDRLDRDKYMNEEEIDRLRAYSEAMALRDLEHGRRFYPVAWAVIDTLLSTGIRASECRNMKISDVDLGKTPAIHVIGKGSKKYPNGKPRTIEIGKDLKKHLTDFIKWKKLVGEDISQEAVLFATRLGGPYTLMGIQTLFKKMRDGAGLRPVYSIHATRHSFGFISYGKSKNLRLVQTVLGHSNPSTTAIHT